jgi:ribonucleoside-diphosphate reductase alpha chain
MQEHHRQRYLSNDYIELAKRVTTALQVNDNCAKLIASQTFIPAGNTLLAGAAPITPNCCVLGRLDEDNFADMLELSRKLWAQRTGIGFDLSGLADPVARLRQLSSVNDGIDLGHRPKRGNMAVLSSQHPKILEFITCKNGNDIYNFNISVSIVGELDSSLLRSIAESAWKTGDPGLIFLDRAQTYGPVAAQLEPIVTCVPCGEQFMHAFETCNLSSINLNSPHLLVDGAIDEQLLRDAVREAVAFMDDVVDHLVFPDEKIRQTSLDARRIGLGVMGWADYLKRVGADYDSPFALALAQRLSHWITQCAEEKSRELAIERGPCAHSTEYRNISLTCIAPTGGITGLTQNKGHAIEPYFEDASHLDYVAHINMQAAWQSGLHNAVSKTINLRESATVQDIIDAYQYARASGVKGITVYRDKCRDNQPIALCPQCT